MFATALSGLSLLEGLWTPPEPPEQSEKVAETLRQIRGTGCTGATDPNANAFAETAFGRGEFPRDALAPQAHQAMAGIFAAESDSVRMDIAAPFLDGPDDFSAASVRIAVAYAKLRHQTADGTVRRELQELLAAPSAIDGFSDTHYLRAVLALERRAYAAAGDHATRALALAPEFYNGHVVHGLALLATVPDMVERGNCDEALAQVTAAIEPLFENGACKLHVGHFDLAARRYLPRPRSAAAHEARLIRAVVLAYISGKDETAAALKESATTGRCAAALVAATGE